MNALFSGLPTYVLSGGLAVLLSWALSGCRFGNNTEETPTPPPSYTAYYETAPEDVDPLVYCNTDVNDVQTCTNASTSNQLPQAPFDFQNSLGNPVVLQVLNDESGLSAVYVNPEIAYFQVFLDRVIATEPTVNFSVGNGDGWTETAWDDPNCIKWEAFGIDGGLNRSNPGSVNGISTSGRMELRVLDIIEFQGDCAASMQAIYECYLDLAACGASPTDAQARVRGIFADHVIADNLTPSDIPHLRRIAYEIRYR